jgi:hypothetical protein
MPNNLARLRRRRCCHISWLTRPRRLCSLLHNPVHASQSILNLGAIRNLLSRELVPAQSADQIRPELELPQPDLEHLVAVRTGQIDPHASMIFEQVASFG